MRTKEIHSGVKEGNKKRVDAELEDVSPHKRLYRGCTIEVQYGTPSTRFGTCHVPFGFKLV